MVSQIKRGVLDLIGAARPSIADPFLPKKVEEGRPEDIRECIGCNICASGDKTGVPIRCTQNPTMGEEWRKGWHPEVIAPKGSDDQVLVVGAGPAGLECARALGRRGYGVILAEAEEELGGRVAAECRLPGLAAWGRVRDYRLQQLHLMPNVELYPASRLTAENVLEFGFPRVVLATGCHWRKDGMGRQHHRPIPGSEQDHVVAPEAVMAGEQLAGPIVIYDDDHFYLGAVLSEKLRAEGHQVAIVTPALQVSLWTENTLEQRRVELRLLELGVEIVTQRRLEAIGAGEAELSCLMTGRRETRAAGSVVLVTARWPEEALYQALTADAEALAAAGIASLTRIGDCLAPATIAAAVYAGHRCARELDSPVSEGAPFARELAALDPDFGREGRP